jgi:hypothetical protein
MVQINQLPYDLQIPSESMGMSSPKRPDRSEFQPLSFSMDIGYFENKVAGV